MAGASIICVDMLVQRLPRYRDWRIQDSNAFLSASLSLSFGVMLYSSLYNMLPGSKSYLIQGGMSPSVASWVLIACFLGGVIGITIVSRIIHHHMPSHVVDCDHSHDDMEEEEEMGTHAQQDHEQHRGYGHSHRHYEEEDEDTPLLSRSGTRGRPRPSRVKTGAETQLRFDAPSLISPVHVPVESDVRRPSLKPSLTKRMTSFMAGGKAQCDEFGPCRGYTELCGQECFKVMSRSPTRASIRKSMPTGVHRSATYRSTLRQVENDEECAVSASPRGSHSCVPERRAPSRQDSGHSHDSHLRPYANGHDHGDPLKAPDSIAESEGAAHHHHHLPANAFLSIGLQTSIAIALHKLPEGFITYATNHANPKLGFAVFMALFIHNITEGFAMALPLYLAVGSRAKAMLWSSLLGGVSQPLGAGIAALWFHAADSRDMAPSEVVYGAMFAVTSGIMASVALQLFSESLGLTHNKNVCTTFAFVGMGILGISNALTA